MKTLSWTPGHTIILSTGLHIRTRWSMAFLEKALCVEGQTLKEWAAEKRSCPWRILWRQWPLHPRTDGCVFEPRVLWWRAEPAKWKGKSGKLGFWVQRRRMFPQLTVYLGVAGEERQLVSWPTVSCQTGRSKWAEMKVQGSAQLAVVKAGERRCFKSSGVWKNGAQSKQMTHKRGWRQTLILSVFVSEKHTFRDGIFDNH